jgi:hypothetical protein
MTRFFEIGDKMLNMEYTYRLHLICPKVLTQQPESSCDQICLIALEQYEDKDKIMGFEFATILRFANLDAVTSTLRQLGLSSDEIGALAQQYRSKGRSTSDRHLSHIQLESIGLIPEPGLVV